MQQILTCEKCSKKIESKCLACLGKELIDWRPSLAIDFDEKIEKFNEKIQTEHTCKTCNNTINICTNCFHTYIYNWLQEEHSELTEEFMAFFNIHD